MATKDVTWRDHPFEVGKTYIARQTFTALPSGQFLAGRQYVFDQVEYSHYDSTTVFLFHPSGASNSILWWWHDDQPEALCFDRFKVIDDERT